MSEQKQIQRKQEQLLQERQMKLYQEDQKTIRQLQKNPQEKFHYSRRRSLTRNYRNYALTQALRQEEPAGAAFAQVLAHLEGRSVLDGTTPPTVPVDRAMREKPHPELLRVNPAITALCHCPLAAKVVSPQELTEMTEHLSAGHYLKRQEGEPQTEEYSGMHRAGLAALKEIYVRLLDQVTSKYGTKLTSISAGSYLQRRAEIEADLSFLKDMKLLLTAHTGGSTVTDQSILQRVTYYLNTMEVLRDRSDAITEGLGESVTKKGDLTRKARKDYDSRRKTLLEDAKRGNAFRPRPETDRVSLDRLFDATRQRQKRAKDLYLTFRSEAEDPFFAGLETDVAADQITQQLIEYRYYLNYLKAAKTGETESIRSQARAGVEAYLQNPAFTLRTQAQADALAAKLEALQNREGPQLEGVVTDITLKNAAELVESSIRDYEQLTEFMERSSDLVFLQDCQDMDQLALKVSFQAQNIVQSSVAAKLKKLIQGHESGQKPLSDAAYEYNKALLQRYNHLRELRLSDRLKLDRVTDAMSTRLKSIADYGCTQNSDRTALTDPLTLRRTMAQNLTSEEKRQEQDRLKEKRNQKQALLDRTKSPVVQEQLRREIGLLNGRIDALRRTRVQAWGINQIEYKSFDYLLKFPELAVSRELDANLEEMNAILKLKETDPLSYFHDGGYKGWAKRQFLSQLQPLYQELLDLTYRRLQLKDQGGMSQAQLETRWQEVNKAYNAKYLELEILYPIEHSMGFVNGQFVHETSEEHKRAAAQKRLDYERQRFTLGRDCRDELEQKLLKQSLPEALSREELHELLDKQAWSFAVPPSPEAVMDVLVRLKAVAQTAPDALPSSEAMAAGLFMIQSLNTQLNQCMTALRQGEHPFSETRFMLNLGLITRCALMEEAFTSIMSDHLLDELARYGEDFPQEDQEALKKLPENRTLIRTLQKYALGLQLNQAGASGLSRLKLDFEGEELELPTSALIRQTGSCLVQEGLSLLQPLMKYG